MLYWIGAFFAVVAGALILFRWLFAQPDVRNYELRPEEHPQPWSDPARFGED